MAGSPIFNTVPQVGSASIFNATAETSYTAPTHGFTILSAAPITPAATFATNSGSNLLTASANFQALNPNPQPAIGWQAYGPGIPVGTTVIGIQGTNLWLSNNATATAGAISITFVCAGLKLDEVDLFGIGVTLAGATQLYLFDGTAYHAIFTLLVTAVTPSATVAPFIAAIPFDFFEIPSGWSLYAASFVASQNINVVAWGANL